MAVEVLERHANVDEVLREVSRIKSIVTEAVEDGVKTALRTMKQGREATEDAIHDARHAIKRNPLQAAGIMFAAGILIGSLVTLISSPRD
ncbi:MAG: hypothetical protein ABSD70_09345 [Terracidiphilus sp.]|jgi:ElaB/YqjD/DUF883 family membrane-anchored ribosome-binding protein